MNRFMLGVLASEGFALWLEFFYKFGFQKNVTGFLVSIPIYFVVLCVLHGIFLRLEGIRLHGLVGFVCGGVVGLMIEWFLVGNSPWNNPKALQSAQFLFHAVYPILGYQLVRTRSSLRSRLGWYMLAATLIGSVGFLIPTSPLRSLWFLFFPLLVFVGLCYFVYSFSGTKVDSSAGKPEAG